MTIETAASGDGVKIAYESTGAGTPVLFIHEFGGDMRSWQGQVDALSDRFQCVRFNARGYPPSDVPPPGRYSQPLATADAIAVLDALGIGRAHIVGVSMGGYTSLNLAVDHPGRVRSVTVAGCGWGSDPAGRQLFEAEQRTLVSALRDVGWAGIVDSYAMSPARATLRRKSETAWRAFRDGLAEHSSEGSANTMEGVQLTRPTLDDLIPGLARSGRPLLIITGDEDDGAIEANYRLKRTLETASWAVLARTGHAVNLEEPQVFAETFARFVESVDSGAWKPRDRDALVFSSTGL